MKCVLHQYIVFFWKWILAHIRHKLIAIVKVKIVKHRSLATKILWLIQSGRTV